MSVFSPALLRAARASSGKSREQLAVDIGRSYSAIVQYESGASSPSLGTLVELADALGVHPGDLFAEAER